MVQMQIHNTFGRQTVPFVPRVGNEVGMYVCGATVQSQPHLGHGRYAVAFDVIRRYLMSEGYHVTYVENVTDVEDKIIAAANERGITTEAVVAESKKSFDATYQALGILPPDIKPHATDHIEEMIEMIEGLVAKGIAYPSDGDVYFRVRRHKGYGRLSGRNVDDLLSGARVVPGDSKEDPLDFALWKTAKPGEPAWESPWGLGRPGWHIECSAMARTHLGDTIDIHGGGSDLIFPHHENEIAQSEAYTGQPFAKNWLHNGMVTMGGEKMSKSTGLVYDLVEATETYPPLAVRLFYLRAHYRSPLEYSVTLLEDATASYERLSAFVRRISLLTIGAPEQEIMDRFELAMNDDFNTPEALAVLFAAVRRGNQLMDQGVEAEPVAAAAVQMLEILGLALNGPDLSDLADKVVGVASEFGVDPNTTEGLLDSLAAIRSEARTAKDWAKSDAIRDRLARLGIVMEDTADGIRWHRS